MLSHESARRTEKARVPANRAFGLVLGVAFLLIGAIPILGGELRLYWWCVWVGVAFLAAAMLFPAILLPLNRLWFHFGMALHVIVSPVVLGIMFYLVVFPTGLLMRAAGKDPLRLRFDREARSYWIERDPPGPAADSFRDQF